MPRRRPSGLKYASYVSFLPSMHAAERVQLIGFEKLRRDHLPPREL